MCEKRVKYCIWNIPQVCRRKGNPSTSCTDPLFTYLLQVSHNLFLYTKTTLINSHTPQELFLGPFPQSGLQKIACKVTTVHVTYTQTLHKQKLVHSIDSSV